MRTEQGFFYWDKSDTPEMFPGGYFSTSEFTCHCKYDDCVEQKASIALISRLQRVRGSLEKPIGVNRGYSCQKHQADLVGQGLQAAAPDKSMHPQGGAADIWATDMSALYREVATEFHAIGLAHTWLHCDTRDDKNRRWTYA